jgi:hypothetical protein
MTRSDAGADQIAGLGGDRAAFHERFFEGRLSTPSSVIDLAFPARRKNGQIATA